jgi:hypothetical protein
MSKDGPRDVLVNVFESTHRHFPNFLECRPIYARRALKEAGFAIGKVMAKHMWIHVEVVLGFKP